MAANIIVLLGSCARSEYQAVGGGGRRDLQELLHKDGPLQEEGRHRKKYKKDGIGCGKDYKIDDILIYSRGEFNELLIMDD